MEERINFSFIKNGCVHNIKKNEVYNPNTELSFTS